MGDILISEQIFLKIDIVKKKWQELKEQIEVLIKSKEKQSIQTKMEESVELLQEFVLLTNGIESIYNQNQLAMCKIKPMNFKERLDFIHSRPMLYHSFIQLTELFHEQEKQFAKAMARRGSMK